jgi:hypothetical protein
VLVSRHLIVVALMLVGPPVAAAELAADGPLEVDVHAFVSQGFIVTSENNYLAKSKQGSFEFTEVGLNFTKLLTDQLRVGIQLFARDLGPIGNYSAKLDWFYLDYRLADWLGFRAGRVKVPFGLLNDTSDIDAARVPILLPQSIYPTQNRDFLLAQTGAELYGYLSLGKGGALDYRLFAGTIFLELPEQSNAAISVQEVTTPYVVGGRVLWEAPLDGLRLGGSVEALRLDTTFMLGPTRLVLKLPAVLWVASVEYSAHELLLSVEYSRWHIRFESSDPALFPNGSSVSERGYVMAAYRVNSWLQPGLYYSMLYPNVADRSAFQHDFAATVRFDINPHWLVKLEGHYMRGTAALSSALNDNTPTSALSPSWAVFMVKTTASF